MPQFPLFDTNVYGNHEYNEILQIALQRKHWLSSVVVQELLVIADRKEVVRWRVQMDEAAQKDLLITPDRDDWYEVGRCLNRLHFGQVVDIGRLDQSHLSNLVKDALIARSAVRVGGFVVTDNASDFELIQRVFRSLRFVTPSSYFQTRPR